VLDPNVKDTYMRYQWDADQFDAGMEQLKRVVSILYYPCSNWLIPFKFDSYYVALTSKPSGVSSKSIFSTFGWFLIMFTSEKSPLVANKSFAHYGASFWSIVFSFFVMRNLRWVILMTSLHDTSELVRNPQITLYSGGEYVK
jgi:hypothetical protein